MDLADAVLPLWLEERMDDRWREVHRWESLNPGMDLYRFQIPVGMEQYQIRFGIRDAAGNVSYAVVGPRKVNRSIRLNSLDGGDTLKAGINQSITWTIHPAWNELSSELKVVVAHQPREGGDWIQLYDDLPVNSACIWTVPEPDSEIHRLRVSLLHRGQLCGEDATGPLRITGAPSTLPRVEPRVVNISEESLYYSNRAELQFKKYRTIDQQYRKWYGEITAGLRRDARGNLAPGELEKLSPDLRRQAAERERQLSEAAQKIRENFQKALEQDSRNYHAAYGMAQLLHRIQPGNLDATIRYLERTVEIARDHAAALNDLGACRILRGEYEKAEAPLRQAVAVEDLGSYQYNLALALFHQNKTADARQHFEEALKRGGSAVRPGEVYYYIVSAFIQEGQREEARRRLEMYRDQIPASLKESLSAVLENS
jgi:Tfp pilus assembly protein PilF